MPARRHMPRSMLLGFLSSVAGVDQWALAVVGNGCPAPPSIVGCVPLESSKSRPSWHRFCLYGGSTERCRGRDQTHSLPYTWLRLRGGVSVRTTEEVDGNADVSLKHGGEDVGKDDGKEEDEFEGGEEVESENGGVGDVE
ncbi:unnamed protein product, partial [Discosporangium mesarthrocarpum]